MNRIWLLALLLLVGCAATQKSDYKYQTFAQIQAKAKLNQQHFDTMWNKWKYAGSDDQFDYIYEYKPGIFPGPDTNFSYYKLDPNQVNYKVKHDFAPDAQTNETIFSN